MNDLTESDKQLLYNFFCSLTPITKETFQGILSYIEKKSFKKGETILKEGEIETKSCVVVKGVVLQYVYEDDVPMTVNITPSGFTFNSLKSFMEGSPSLEVQEAITDAEVLCIKKDDMAFLAKNDHDFCYLLFRIYEGILLDRENRMFMLQSKSPKKRFQLFMETITRTPKILQFTPDKYVASYLNMTPQQFSREKKHYFNDSQ